jgi:hypothetical protein
MMFHDLWRMDKITVKYWIYLQTKNLNSWKQFFLIIPLLRMDFLWTEKYVWILVLI